MKVVVPSLAKLNLSLRVLHRRSDGYHELRTIFQTISLQDRIAIEYQPARRPDIQLESSIDIPDNLVVSSAKLVMDRLKLRASVRISLKKRLPMGAGLGGGSSNAASVLIALPALAGKRVPPAELVYMAECLGSDVPFFLFGGTALGIGRGTEIYPLPELPAYPGVVVSTGIHVSTTAAYKALARKTLPDSKAEVTDALTSAPDLPILREFQAVAWALNGSNLAELPLTNDFEKPVFETHHELSAVAKKLRRSGATLALMTGSGSAIFGVFRTNAEADLAVRQFAPGGAFPMRFVSRRKYRQLWHRALGPAAAASCFGTPVSR